LALDADFVVIASPTPTHPALVRRLRVRPLLCDTKRVPGGNPGAAAERRGGGRRVRELPQRA
jgi:hypothetical protein